MRFDYDDSVIDLQGTIHHRTELAILFSETGDEDDAVWLPLSQIEIEKRGALFEITLPEWLAVDKGLA